MREVHTHLTISGVTTELPSVFNWIQNPILDRRPADRSTKTKGESRE